MFQWEHILVEGLFISIVLLFNLQLLGVCSKIEVLFLPDFSESAGSIISLAIWLDVLSEFGPLVPQCKIMWSGSKSQTVGFAWSCMHLSLTELNYRTLTRHLLFRFRVRINRLISLPCCLQVWKQILLRLVTTGCY